MERLNLTMKELKDLVRFNLSFISIGFCVAPMSLFVHLYIYHLNNVGSFYLNESRKLLYQISHLDNNT